MEGTDAHPQQSLGAPARRRPPFTGRAALLWGLVLAGVIVVGVTVVAEAPEGRSPVAPQPRAVAPIEEPQWVARPTRAAGDPGRGGPGRAARPNIVLITADDMASTDLRWMPWTRRLLGGAGVGLTNFLSNHPICCPARAEILTGQYGHNNGVHDNDGTYGGHQALLHPADTVGAWMKAAGYRTAFVGKHLNGWETDARPDGGWTVFNPLLRNVYHYYDYTLYRDGSPRRFTGTHSTDVIGRFTRTYVKRFSRTGSPFFIWASPLAPHNRMTAGGWRTPAAPPRHRGTFQRLVPPSLGDPAFNEPDVSDKPPYVATRGPLPVERARIDHRARIRSLQSLDEQVRRIVATLRATGELESTYLFFTSDNGYLLGEHRLHGKNLPYEESLTVPLLVRGPGLPRGVSRPEQFGLVDLAPTFLDLAGATSGGRVLDGRSMLRTLRVGGGGYRHYLIQAGTRDVPWWWRGVRSNRFVYVRYTSGFEELYDLRADPAQLTNVATDPSYAVVRSRLSALLDRLATCAGSSCWAPGKD